MQKTRPVILFLIFSLMLFPHNIVCAEELDIDAGATFVLPLAIQSIEDEAFSGTAVKTVILPEGLQSIGNHAFEGRALRDVYIPPSAEYISESAFAQNRSIVIHGVEGSRAHGWAEEHQLPFVEENIWRFFLDHGNTGGVHEVGLASPCQLVNPDQIGKIAPGTEEVHRSKRPQDRPELNPIDYRFP